MPEKEDMQKLKPKRKRQLASALTKQKISESMKKYHETADRKYPNISDEQKQKISKALINKPKSAETKQKMSEAAKRRWNKT